MSEINDMKELIDAKTMNAAMAKLPIWLRSGYNDPDEVVLYSKVVVARNLQGVPFPIQASDADLKKVLQQVSAMKTLLHKEYHTLPEVQKMDKMSVTEREALYEETSISMLHAIRAKNRGLIRDEANSINIMINEEDHLRIQVAKAGLNLMAAYEEADQIDDLLESKLEIAFDAKWGYLTSCATLLGTGLKAYVALHLPAMTLTQEINSIITLSKMRGIVVQGLAGEASPVVGNVFLVSNDECSGKMEQDILQEVMDFAEEFADKERIARKKVYRELKPALEQVAVKSWEQLNESDQLSYNELVVLVGRVCMGIYFGLLDIDLIRVRQLLVLLSDHNIKLFFGDENIDIEQKRARLVKTFLA